MNEQFYIDWVNSLFLPDQIFINKIEDLYNNDTLLSIISFILNKSRDELLLIIGSSLSQNMLENICSLMDKFFNYKFNCMNNQTLKYNTIKLLQFLKTRYQQIIDDKKTNSLNKNSYFTNYRNNNYYKKIYSFTNLTKTGNNDKFNNYIIKDYQSSSNKKIKLNPKIVIEGNNSKKLQNFSLMINSSNNLLLNKELDIGEKIQKIFKLKKYKESKKLPNFFIKTLGISILDKSDNSLFYYKLLKPTNPLLKINLENPHSKITPNYLNKNTYYCLPYFLKSLVVKNKEENTVNNVINNDIKKNYNCAFDKNKLKFIIDYLYRNKILSDKQKNESYLKKYFIPQLRDGYKFGKIINILENKTENYLKGITDETFYKINIFYNWKNIFEFLSNKSNFNSVYLFEKNFYENNIKLFNFLYDVLLYYHKNKTPIIKKKSTPNKINITNHYISLESNNYEKIIKHTPIKTENLPKKVVNREVEHDSTTYGRRLKSNASFSSSNLIKNKINKSLIIKTSNKNLKNIPSFSELINIRKNINYHHLSKKQSSFFDGQHFKNTEFKNKYKTKGEDEKFDIEVFKIIEFLEKIGVDTSNINFYEPEMKIFKDGILIYRIIKQIENNISLLPKIDFKPQNPTNAVNNHRLILNFLEKYKSNFPIKFLNKERELYKACPEFILSFLQMIKDLYKNEINYYELLNKKREVNYENDIKKINFKNIDKSERDTLPLSQEMREKFIETDNSKYWA